MFEGMNFHQKIGLCANATVREAGHLKLSSWSYFFFIDSFPWTNISDCIYTDVL